MLAKQLAHSIPVRNHRPMLANWAVCIKGAESRLCNMRFHIELGTKPPDAEPGEWEREKAQEKRLTEKAWFLRVLSESFARETNNHWRVPEEL